MIVCAAHIAALHHAEIALAVARLRGVRLPLMQRTREIRPMQEQQGFGYVQGQGELLRVSSAELRS